ncbi:MAG: hypothetical protein H7144_18320 [Burkholderiales bacterium]|nr:hypothetical protein [Phycisphaerae bacterium]
MLEFEPGSGALKCGFCGTLNEIPKSDHGIAELDYEQQLEELKSQQPVHEATVIHCDGCGGESTLPDGQSSGLCPFCGRAVVATSIVRKQIKPKALLPFAIQQQGAKQRFDQWLGSLWFAPSGLKKFADAGGLGGVYLPAWTFDCHVLSDYTGRRGDHYYDTESYTAMVNGKSMRQTRQVRRTRWSGASGSVQNAFDDLLVLADRSLPPDLRSAMQDWDLPALVPYQDDYLSGFVTETYQVELQDGFETAKQMMDPQIRATVRADIGGDEQQISSLESVYRAITFKHILVPVWISAYRYKDKTFRFAINGRTGTVFGQRPWSAWKIVSLVAVILLAILIIVGIVAAAQ